MTPSHPSAAPDEMPTASDSYERLLEEVVGRALAGGADSFGAVCRASRGAFPSEVLAALRRLGLDARLPDTRPTPAAAHERVSAEAWWPEPSPVDYEWRFTRETAEEVATLALGRGKKILCAGAPTVFRQLLSAGADVFLLDRNPFIVSAFPGVSPDRLFNADITRLSELSFPARFEVVVIDPPWYPHYMAFWLKKAREVLAAGGNIILSIFPELVRPAAADERQAFFQLLAQYGDYRIIPAQAAYETPFFERETLSALKIPPVADWRVGDLLVLEANRRPPLVDITPPVEEQWDHFLFGTQVVAVRRGADAANGRLTAASPYGDGSFLLRSVSARDPVRAAVGFWTSRNRVAVVNGRAKLARYLRGLAEGATPRDAMRPLAPEADEKMALETLTALIGW